MKTTDHKGKGGTKAYFKRCHFYWSIVLSNQEKLDRYSFLLCASWCTGPMRKQWESPGQRTSRSENFRPLTDHLKKKTARRESSQVTLGTRRLHLKGFITVGKEEKNWCLNGDTLIHCTLLGRGSSINSAKLNSFSSVPIWKWTLLDLTV